MHQEQEPRQDGINDLLDDLESSTDERQRAAELDELFGEVDTALEERKRDIQHWPDERKRQAAQEEVDEFTLGTLLEDKDFRVQALAACNTHAPVGALRRLVEDADDFHRMVIANNPKAPADLLDRLTDLTGEPEVLEAVRKHPNLSAVTKYKLEQKLAAR